MTMFISFTNGWKMTLVVLAGLPIISYAKSVQNDDAEETTEDDSDGVSNDNDNMLTITITLNATISNFLT